MFSITPGIEARIGPWLAVAVGVLWLVLLVLLAVHVAKRRSGYYQRSLKKKPPPKALRWVVDIALFLLVCLLAFLAVRFFSPVSVSWYFRIGILSGVLAVIGILIILRECLTLRIAASSKARLTAEKPRLRKKISK
jgi:hypothetical protein